MSLFADRSEDFQPMFWGAVAAGLVPVPLAPDTRRALPVWEHLGRPPVVVDAATASLADGFPSGVRVLALDALREGPAVREPVAAGPDDVAFLQFSSGSTGAPKGVEVTHGAVLANLRQIREASALCADDVVVSWMPYFHDMGLIGTHLAPLAARARQVKVGPMSFAKRPRLWFEVAARHRGNGALRGQLRPGTRRTPGPRRGPGAAAFRPYASSWSGPSRSRRPCGVPSRPRPGPPGWTRRRPGPCTAWRRRRWR
ncbi:Bifunctional protein Aas [Streptomyces californicus]